MTTQHHSDLNRQGVFRLLFLNLVSVTVAAYDILREHIALRKMQREALAGTAD